MSDGWQPLVQHVRAHLGLAARGPHAVVVEDRARQVVARWGAGSGREALTLLAREPHRLDELSEAVLIGETHFLREPARLRHLVEVAVPAVLRERRADHVLTAWSAGCSSGEEAFTIAILLDQVGVRNARVLGSDVSTTALRRASAATYGRWSFRGVPADVRTRYFRPCHEGLQVVPRIRERVSFARLNLVGDPYPGDFDVILCRNVLVYLDQATQVVVARRLAHALAPGGWLLTAVTDPLLPDGHGLETIRTPRGIFYRRPGLLPSPDPALPAPARPTVPDIPARRHPPVRRPPARRRQGARPAPPVPASPQPAAARGHEEVAGVRALLDAGELTQAAAAVRTAVEQWPLETELRYLQAVVALAAGDHEGAVVAATAACYLDPGLPAVHLVLGHAHRTAGDARRAARAWDTARALLRATDPDEVVALTDGEPAGRLLDLLDGALSRRPRGETDGARR